MIPQELKDCLKSILELIPEEEQETPIYQVPKEININLFNLVTNSIKANPAFFTIYKNSSGNGSMFLSSNGKENLAYITVTRNVVIHINSIKRLI